MFISLSGSNVGYACGIKDAINNYFGKTQTQFFDWLICSMKGINQVLQGEKFMFNTKYSYPNSDNATTIFFSDFDLLISYHDVVQPTKENLSEINEKYKRRYARIIDTIKSEKEIYFLRYCNGQNDLDESEIHTFYNNINKLNDTLEFYFVLITINNIIDIPSSLLFRRNFLHINLIKNNKIINDETINGETNVQQFTYPQIINMYSNVFKIINEYKTSNNEKIANKQINYEIIQTQNQNHKKKLLHIKKITSFKQFNEK